MELIDSYADEFLAKFKRISSIIKHGPSIGSYHENIVRSFLSDFLTNRFSVKTGFIYNAETNDVTQQIDIIIIDEFYPSAYYYKEKDFAIVDSKAVVCGIEIKSTFSKKEFADCCEKALDYFRVTKRNTFFCFAFNATLKNIETTLEKWFQYISIEDNIFHYPQGIYLLQNGILRIVAETEAEPWGMYFLRQYEKNKKITEIVISSFLATIMKQCEFKAGIKTGNPYAQYANNTQLALHTTYRYGKIFKNDKSPFKF